MNRLYPIFLKLAGRRCVVVGGGEVAKRKIHALLSAGAHVTAVAKEFDEDLTAIIGKASVGGESFPITLVKKDFEPSDLAGAFLVIGATDDPDVNIRIYDAARSAGALVNIADEPELCDFYVPSSFTRGDLKIAISTNGRAPAFAKEIREKLEKEFDASWGEMVSKRAEERKKWK